MKTYIRLSVLLALLLVAVPVTGETLDGGYSGAFFQVPIGARPTAMGGAYRAVSDDGLAPLFNPAGLSDVTSPLFSSSYRAMAQDRQLGYMNVAFPVQGEATLAFSWLYAGSGSVRVRDGDGTDLGREFSFDNHQFSALFAKRFEKYLSVGVNLSYLYSRFPEVNANSIGIDFGGILHVDQLIDRERRDLMKVQDIRLALTVRHINKKFKWNSEKYNIAFTTDDSGFEQDDQVPIEVGLGASAKFFQRKLLGAVDVFKNREQGVEFAVGGEYLLVPEFALRAGYGQSRLTAGTGYQFKLGTKQLRVDYAFSTDRVDEGSEHIFSFDLMF